MRRPRAVGRRGVDGARFDLGQRLAERNGLGVAAYERGFGRRLLAFEQRIGLGSADPPGHIVVGRIVRPVLAQPQRATMQKEAQSRESRPRDARGWRASSG